MADLINVAIEELVRKKYQLPAFDTLVRGARHARSILDRQYYQQVAATLGTEEKARSMASLSLSRNPVSPPGTTSSRSRAVRPDASQSLVGPAGLVGSVSDRIASPERHSRCKGPAFRGGGQDAGRRQNVGDGAPQAVDPGGVAAPCAVGARPRRLGGDAHQARLRHPSERQRRAGGLPDRQPPADR